MVLFLVDRNKVWRQFFWIVGSLCLAAILVIGGLFGWAAWREHRAEKAQAIVLDFSKYAEQQASTPASVPIPPGAVIGGGRFGEKKHKRFGNATVQADTAIVWNGSTIITTLFHPTRVLVTGENGSKYRVRLADGRTGEMEMSEVKKDTTQ